MDRARRLLLPAVCLSLLASARAQSGTLDQANDLDQACFLNVDATTLTWQAQVHAGLSGRLEGFTLRMSGPVGATLSARLRVGPAWNTSPVLFQTVMTKPTANDDDIFVDVTSAQVDVVPGTLFVIETQGMQSGCWLKCTTGATYSEPMFLNGMPYTGQGSRFWFRTWVLDTVGTLFCSGDGSGTACPCGNAGQPTNGCANSLAPGGAHLSSTGWAGIANDVLVLHGSGMPNSAVLYFQGTQEILGGAGIVFGDGLRCVGGTIRRLGTHLNVNGSSSCPSGNDAPISISGMNSGGVVRQYQAWYRNAASFCTPSTYNMTNAVELTWVP